MQQENFEEKYKLIIDLLYKHIEDDESRKKPLIPHLLRVGKYLHKNNYSEDVVKAGLLHDAIEWTDITKEYIKDEYGEHVLKIVLANTKDRDIDDVVRRREDYVSRCSDVGTDALIVKAADVIDSYNYYKEKNNQDELYRSINIAQTLLKKIKDSKSDPIFEELEKIN